MRFSTSIEVLLIFVTVILAPLLITITGNVISEWIVRKWLDKRDKKIKPEFSFNVTGQKEIPEVELWYFCFCQDFVTVLVGLLLHN